MYNRQKDLHKKVRGGEAYISLWKALATYKTFYIIRMNRIAAGSF
jgi:hypothetical protein